MKNFTKEQDIYEMKLHDDIIIRNIQITRVAGGWIYEIIRGNTQRHTATFIPYNEEFKKEKS